MTDNIDLLNQMEDLLETARGNGQEASFFTATSEYFLAVREFLDGGAHYKGIPVKSGNADGNVSLTLR